ncbi:MAG: amidase [Polyangiales bacterium]
MSGGGPLRELLALSALDQAALLRRGELTCEALTAAYLTRIEARDGALGAFAHVGAERALAAARALDRQRRRDPHQPRGPLWGLPTGLKDLHFTAGAPARMGSRAWRHMWSPFDDATSAAVRRAGLVITGKLTTSELAILPFVETDLGPPTRNPWDLELTAGGSSGGSAAAVAGGLLPIAPGSDGAGSIRIPAAFCGLVGLKTTRDLVPNPMNTFDTIGISVIGPIARSVPDAAALLDVLAGDPHGGFSNACWGDVPSLRVATTVESPLVETHPDVVTAVDVVARVLGELGHRVQAAPALEGTVAEFLPIFQYLVAAQPVISARLLQPTTRWLRDAGRDVHKAHAMHARHSIAQRVDALLADTDLWVVPTVAVPPLRVGELARCGAAERFDRAALLGAWTAALNASGNPALTLPVMVGGRPLGVQLVGKRGDDGRLLALGRAVLDALGTPLVTMPA